MARSRQVTIQFLGDAKGLISASNAAGRSTTTLGDKLKRVGKAALVGFGVAAIAAGKVMYDMAEAAAEDSKAADLLAQTLKNTTGATKAQIGANEDWISTQGQLLGVTDDDLRPAIGKLATATGSLTEAQKDASIAMDVSAGAQKSLSQVSQAVARAISTNSVGALGRYGVATKDAEGKTRSLNDVLADLAKKYSGDAATAAETTSGKFQRLKVDLSETAEAIGYKLLPVADDLGNWLLKDGVPAVEHLAHSFKQELGPVLRDAKTWVSDNKDELKDLGKEIAETVIPAVRTLGGYVGSAVTFFAGLPGPIKAVGIEAGAAALIIPRLSSAIDAVTTSVGMNATKLGGWRKGLLLAAGVGGIGAIAEGARTGNKAVSLFGDAMTGAFVGGTLGSAIPGVGTAIGAVGGAAVGAGIGLFKMHKSADAAGDSSRDATPKIDGLKESLNQVTGASTRATKALILQKLQQDGVVASAGQLGISTSDLIKASLGNQKAIERVSHAWESQGSVLDGIQNQDIASWIYGMRRQLDAAQGDVKKTNAALDGTDRSAGKAGRALKNVGKERPQTDKWSALLIGDLNKSVTNTDSKSSDMRRLLSGNIGKARADMGPFAGDLAHQLAGVKQHAGSAGVGIGNAIESGVHTGLSGIISSVVNTIQAAINAAQQAAHAGGGGGGGGGKGKGGSPKTAPRTGKVYNLDDYRQGMDPRKAEVAGSALLNSIVRGIKKGERTLHNVMQGLQDYIQTKTDKLNEILSDRSSFVQSFRDAFSESIFSAQFSDSEGNQVPPTLAKMMEFAKQQQANAHALSGNIKSLLAKGLSKDLIRQLVAQGASGAQQIAALATGSQADIDAFNAINADIKATLESLGTELYNALNPNAQAQIDLLTSQVASAQATEAHLKRIADNLDKGDKIEIKGTDLVILLHKLERATGNKYLVS